MFRWRLMHKSCSKTRWRLRRTTALNWRQSCWPASTRMNRMLNRPGPPRFNDVPSRPERTLTMTMIGVLCWTRFSGKCCLVDTRTTSTARTSRIARSHELVSGTERRRSDQVRPGSAASPSASWTVSFDRCFRPRRDRLGCATPARTQLSLSRRLHTTIDPHFSSCHSARPTPTGILERLMGVDRLERWSVLPLLLSWMDG